MGGLQLSNSLMFHVLGLWEKVPGQTSQTHREHVDLKQNYTTSLLEAAVTATAILSNIQIKGKKKHSQL